MESKEEEGAELMDVIHQAARCHAKEAAAVSHQDADFDRVSRRFRYRVFSFSFPFFFWYRIFFLPSFFSECLLLLLLLQQRSIHSVGIESKRVLLDVVERRKEREKKERVFGGAVDPQWTPTVDPLPGLVRRRASERGKRVLVGP